MKKKITMIATEDTYRNLSTFKTIESLNEALRQHKCELTGTILAVLDLLAQHSCKHVGVSFLRKNKIAELIGKSRRTVIRACNQLEGLGIIRQYEMKRTSDMRQTVNAIVIQPIQGEQQASVTQETPESVTPKNSDSIKQNNNYTKETVMASECLRRSIPSAIFNAMSPYFNADELYKAYGTLLRAKASIDRSITVEKYANEFVDAFKVVVYAFKRGKVRKLNGCLFAAFRQVAVEIKRRLTLQDSSLFYDWLNEDTDDHMLQKSS